MSMKRVPGYCALCRAKEMELYHTVLNTAGKRHILACKEAGCRHPAVYTFPREDLPYDSSQERS